MNRVLAWEVPDLVIYTGGNILPDAFISWISERWLPYLLFIPTDQVTGENINNNATLYWAKLVQPCVQTRTPWATVFGNHGELTS